MIDFLDAGVSDLDWDKSLSAVRKILCLERLALVTSLWRHRPRDTPITGGCGYHSHYSRKITWTANESIIESRNPATD